MAHETYPDVVLGRGNPLEYTVTLREIIYLTPMMFSNPQGNQRENVKQIRQLIHKHVGGNNRNVFKMF